MMRTRMAFLLLILVPAMAACGGKPAQGPARPAEAPAATQSEAPAAAPPAPPTAQPQAPPVAPPAPAGPSDLMALDNPHTLSLEQLAAGLRRYANQDAGPLAPRVEALWSHWAPDGQSGPRTILHVAEADLDGDGAAEVATFVNGGMARPTGAVFVIYRKDGGYAVDQGEVMTDVVIDAVADLDGDGRPEILWSTNDHGAHTAYANFFVSRWRPGALERLPGSDIPMNSPSARTDGRDLLLTGGLIGSAGAGEAQREYTDRYRWVNGALKRVDRVYAPSEYAYHRLQDGIVAEEYGRLADARQAFTQAFEPARETPGRFTPPEWAERFGHAVHAFARFRLGLLLLERGDDPGMKQAAAGAAGPYAGIAGALLQAPDRAGICRAAGAWAEANPEFLEALNSVFGYANPTWQSGDLCGPLPPNRR